MANQQVVIRLVGENDQLRKSLADSQKQIRRLQKDVGNMKATGKGAFKPMAQSMGVAAGATIAAGKAFDFLKGSVKTTVDLTKASAKLAKITGQDVETSAQWVQLAQARGIGATKLTTGFVALSKQITAAANGSGKAAKGLEQLGVSQQAIESGDTNAVLLQLSDGLKNVQNPAERAALAQQFLGRSGKDLIGVLSSGSDELKKQLGIYAGSSAEIAANKDNVLDLAANQRKLTAATDSLKVSIGVALLPVLESLTGVLTRFANLSPNMKKAIMTLVGIGAAVVAINKVKQAFIALRIVMLTNPFTAIATAVVVLAVLIYRNWGRIRAFLGRTWKALKDGVRSLANTVTSWVKRGFLGPVGWIEEKWGRVVNFFRGLPGKLGGAARKAGSAIWNGLKNGAGGILRFFVTTINKLLGKIEQIANTVIGGINRMIRAFNKLPGGDIGELGRILLPRVALAKGGIVTKPTVALIGEAGPEAVVPLTGRNARRAGIGGGQTIQNFTINTTGPVDEQALAAKIGWQLATRGLA